MKSIKQYKDTFSQVHTDLTIRIEDYKKEQKVRKPFKKIIVPAAVFCLLLVSFGTVYAANLFGVRELILTSLNEADGTAAEYDIISLQGYMDSDEYRALEEWIEFTNSYDRESTVIYEADNEPTGLEEKYNIYAIYTQEMADKLEEIVAKYGLKLHTSMQQCSSKEEFFQMIGRGDFLGTINEVDGHAYVYEDGSFFYNGTANLSDEKATITYQFISNKNDSFSNIVLNIGNVDDYDEWTYKTAKGITVTISTSPNKSLLTVELNNSFVVINILTKFSSSNIAQENLEAFADSIDFSMIN